MLRILHVSDTHYGLIANGKPTPKPRKPGKLGKRAKAKSVAAPPPLASAHAFTTAAGHPDPEALAKVLVEGPSAERPDVMVISGDVGWSGVPDDYAYATAFVRNVRKGWPGLPIVVAAGNHDLDFARDQAKRQDAFRSFLDSVDAAGWDSKRTTSGLDAREQLFSVFDYKSPTSSERAIFVAINSAAYIAKMEDHEGLPIAVGPELLKYLASSLSAASNDALRVFVLHHHLFPFANPQWQATWNIANFHDRPDPTMLANSARLQGWLSDNKFHLVLHGHKHQSHGRLDTLWRPADPPQGRQMFVVGAGSASVKTTSTGHLEPLSYNVITASKQTQERWQLRVDVQKTDDSVGYPRSSPHYSYGSDVGKPPQGSVTIFHATSMTDCHLAIRRAVDDECLLRGFVSIVDEPEFNVPSSASIGGKKLDLEVVRSAFIALHPEYPLSKDWEELTNLERNMRETSPRFQFQHGPRLFGRTSSGREDKDHTDRPICHAVERLASDSKSNAYVSLYNRGVDAALGHNEPLPALMGLQFVRDGAYLDLYATFRKIELSFWWTVNMYECIKLLDWAAKRDRRKPRRITFFSALAEWKSKDPEAAIITRLDARKLGQLLPLVIRVVRKEAEASEELAMMLDEKCAHTNAKNLDPSGLQSLRSILQGLHQSVEIQDSRLSSLVDRAAAAADSIEAAMSARALDVESHITRLRAELGEASVLLRSGVSTPTAAPPGPSATPRVRRGKK